LRIIGIDPALRYTGLAILNDGKASAVTLTNPKGDWRVALEVLEPYLWSHFGPDCDMVVIEDLQVHARALRQLKPLIYVQGGIFHSLMLRGHPYMYVTPGRLRSFAGMKRKDSGSKLDKWLGVTGKTSHEVDALVLALMGACKLRLYPVSKHQQSILDRIRIHGQE